MEFYQIVVYHGPEELITGEELIEITGIGPDLLRYYLDYGLIEPVETGIEYLVFHIDAIPRIRMIQRLRTDMGINLSGIAIILNLRDQVEKLQHDLARYQNL